MRRRGGGWGVGTYDGPAGAPDSTRGAVASAPFPREDAGRTCLKDNLVWGASGHCNYQNKAWGCRRAPGFQIQISEGIQTLHISERQDSEKVKCSFNVINSQESCVTCAFPWLSGEA